MKTNASLQPEQCIPNKSGTKLFFKTSRVNEISSDGSSDNIFVDLRLLMDGVRKLYMLDTDYPEYSRMFYQNDSILYKFGSKNHIFLYNKTSKHLEIKGNYITDMVLAKDVNVTIGYKNCPIILLKNKRIYCKPSTIPPKNAEHQQFQVRVQIGYRIYDISWVIFVSSP